MINLTRLNGKEFSLNALYIETVESFPDTTITLTNGHIYVPLSKISQFYKEVHILSNPHIRGERDEE